MEIARGTCEHSDLLGFESPLYFVWIRRLKEKVSWQKLLLRNRITINRSDFFKLSFLRLHSMLLINSLPC